VTASNSVEGNLAATPGRPPGGGLTRVTVNLTPQAVQALDGLTSRTGYSKTDTINRALQVYMVVQQMLDNGGGHLTVQHIDGSLERVHII
jgi:hypothetical protein